MADDRGKDLPHGAVSGEVDIGHPSVETRFDGLLYICRGLLHLEGLNLSSTDDEIRRAVAAKKGIAELDRIQVLALPLPAIDDAEDAEEDVNCPKSGKRPKSIGGGTSHAVLVALWQSSTADDARKARELQKQQSRSPNMDPAQGRFLITLCRNRGD
uniref:Uncharacterized protein n=1 Tax=Pinguiococcus pyrenoidosus TaxID=172671 RepID=A0A7R9Y8W1_9STRA|mmetsp:Transcript_13200/g.48971  ORF Transcript_13200/g.48971 Transcript_13200/m.48971 type:complete len:157 (+) Transcript_13200:167-637(+)|eukprot:scaffold2760_cov272-Pinguiococcus_pyrenoidosus.AAC.2